MDAGGFDLESLLAPARVGEFMAAHWESSPFLLARGRPDFYSTLLPAAELEHVVSAACELRDSSVELLGDPQTPDRLAPRTTDQVGDLFESYRRGATVRVNGAQRLSAGVASLCRSLETSLGCPVRANLYCTPAASKGARLHYDNHDIFILQLSGRKHWRVFRPAVELPLEHVPPLPFEDRAPSLGYARGGPQRGRSDIDEAARGEPLVTPALEAGDLLYLPRGFVHDAETSESESVHLAVGLHVVTWLDLLSVALGQLAQRDARFRRTISRAFSETASGFDPLREEAARLLAAFAESADAEGAHAELTASFVRSRRALGGGVMSATAHPQLDLETRLARRPGAVFRYVAQDGAAGLASAHGALWMPATFAEQLRFVASARSFRVCELPGRLSDAGKLALAKQLVEDGFLKVSDT
jgi:ribosomal protein L16 Arg81 hydroxylase